MFWLIPLALAMLPTAVLSCGASVCLVDPRDLTLTEVITFDGIRSSAGPGHHIDGILALPGAAFAERFAGQDVQPEGTQDRIVGTADNPLVLVPGARGQNFSVVHFAGTTLINGYGAAGFPRREAQGEGAIAVLFDADQSSLSFDLRGGEAGAAEVAFLRRDGTPIGVVTVTPTGEFTVGFRRAGDESDIAGIIITNSDPQGIAIDTLRFGKPPDMS